MKSKDILGPTAEQEIVAISETIESMAYILFGTT